MTTTERRTTVRAAEAHDASLIGTVLSAAFFADPVFRWALPEPALRAAALPEFFTLFAHGFQPLGASLVEGSGRGAALWAPPGEEPFDDEEALVAKVAELCGPYTERMLTVMTLLAEHHPEQACAYLNLIGVDPAAQGHGLGSALMEVALERWDAAGVPAYLEATSELNRALYARHGFVVTAEIRLPDGPSLWPMWREAR